MKKIITFVLFFVLLAAAVSASVSVRYDFKDISTGQPVNNVDSLVYPCLDSGCNNLMLNSLLSGSGNSGANSYITIVFPTNLVTQYGYAEYFFADSYVPQEYAPTWHGTGSTSFTVNFNKVPNCRSLISNIAINNNNGEGSQITISAQVAGAFHDINSLVSYMPPAYVDEFYKSHVEIRFSIYDENNTVVFSDTKSRDIIVDGSASVTSSAWTAQPGNYTAQVETIVTDEKCSSDVPQTSSQDFEVSDSVIPPGILDVNITANPSSGEEPLNSTLTCSVGNGTAPFSYVISYNNTNNVILNTTSGQPSVSTSYVFNDGLYNVTCTVEDADSNIGSDSVLVNVTQATPVCTNHLNITGVEMGSVEIFEGLTYPLNNATVNTGIIPFDYWFTNTANLTIRNVNYTTSFVGQGINLSDNSTTPVINPFATNLESEDFNIPSNLSDGIYNISLVVYGVDEANCSQDDSFSFFVYVNRSVQILPQCSDGFDNDNDSLADAADPGCYDLGTYDPFDDNENDTLPECSDYFDNDNDFFIDYPADPGCINSTDDNESGIEMLDVELTANPMNGIEPLNASFNCTSLNGNAPYNYSLYSDASSFYNALSATSVTTSRVFNDGLYNITCFANDANGRFGYDSLLINTSNQTNQTDNAPVVTLLFPANNSVIGSGNIMFIYEVQDDISQILNCALYTNLTGTFAPSQSQLTVNGFMGVFSVSNVSEGSYIWNVLCSDGINSAFAPGNFTFTVNSSYVDIEADVNITADPTNSTQPLSVQFNSTVSGNMPISYSWNFGDSQASNLPAPQHTYANAGTYTATLTITDADGDIASDSITITVRGSGNQTGGNETDETEDKVSALYMGRIIIYSDLVDDYGEEHVKAGDELFVNVYFENTGDFDLYDIEFRALILDLGLANSVTFDLEAGDHTTKTVMIDIPSDVAPGNYDIQILAYNEEISRVKYRLVTVIA